MDFVSGTDKNLAFRYTDESNWYDLHFITGTSSTDIVLQRVLNSDQYQNRVTVDGMVNGKIYKVKVEIVGEHIKVFVDNELILDYPDAGGRFPSGGIALQASVGADPISEVYFDNVVVSSVGSTPTPTPTPTPPSTTKVVVAPGFGASWNADAILNCKTNGYSGNWILAPYAEDIYKPLLASLVNHWTVLPFYYDWRQQVPQNSGVLGQFINAQVVNREKVNLVGHSMGGLVSRAYLEENGNNNKLSKLMTVGSPHQGSVLAYPAWSAGEVWEDNFLTKVAMTILLKRCGGIFGNNRETIRQIAPSTQNLLPTFDYLRDKKTGQIKPVSQMSAKNNWLPTDNFSPPFFGTTVGTLSGRGYQTIQTIDVKPRSKKDEKKGNWEDGIPSNRNKVTEGDGTVLTSTSQVDGATNKVITQTHSGLVASNEGIQEILNFLSGSNIQALRVSNQTFTEPSSALVVIGYPARLSVLDEEGNTVTDKDGMVFIPNPKSGKYKLKLLPKSEDTLVIVAQFLKDGKVLWKEYHLSNRLPKSSSVLFNNESPIEDALQ